MPGCPHRASVMRQLAGRPMGVRPALWLRPRRSICGRSCGPPWPTIWSAKSLLIHGVIQSMNHFGLVGCIDHLAVAPLGDCCQRHCASTDGCLGRAPRSGHENMPTDIPIDSPLIGPKMQGCGTRSGPGVARYSRNHVRRRVSSHPWERCPRLGVGPADHGRIRPLGPSMDVADTLGTPLRSGAILRPSSPNSRGVSDNDVSAARRAGRREDRHQRALGLPVDDARRSASGQPGATRVMGEVVEIGAP